MRSRAQGGSGGGRRRRRVLGRLQLVELFFRDEAARAEGGGRGVRGRGRGGPGAGGEDLFGVAAQEGDAVVVLGLAEGGGVGFGEGRREGGGRSKSRKKAIAFDDLRLCLSFSLFLCSFFSPGHADHVDAALATVVTAAAVIGHSEERRGKRERREEAKEK